MTATFVVLSGLPASGKSTLGRAIAQALRLPMFDKDRLLEALFEARGIGDAAWRGALSRQADQAMQEQASALPAAVLVSWWRHPNSTTASGTPTEWLRQLPGELIEVHCLCSPRVAASRFVGRARHVGHLDHRYRVDALHQAFGLQAAAGPLRIGRVVEVNTELGPDLDGLLGQLGVHPTADRTRPTR